MYKINLENPNEWPFSEEFSAELANDLFSANEKDILALEDKMALECTNIFNQKELDKLVGFQITSEFVKEETIKMYIKELIIFDNEDEWIEAYKKIKASKDQ